MSEPRLGQARPIRLHGLLVQLIRYRTCCPTLACPDDETPKKFGAARRRHQLDLCTSLHQSLLHPSIPYLGASADGRAQPPSSSPTSHANGCCLLPNRISSLLSPFRPLPPSFQPCSPQAPTTQRCYEPVSLVPASRLDTACRHPRVLPSLAFFAARSGFPVAGRARYHSPTDKHCRPLNRRPLNRRSTSLL